MARQSILDAGKTPSWAGATPLLGAFGCPKNHGGRSSPGNGMRVPFTDVFCPRPGKQITHKEEGYVDHQQTTGTR